MRVFMNILLAVTCLLLIGFVDNPLQAQVGCESKDYIIRYQLAEGDWHDPCGNYAKIRITCHVNVDGPHSMCLRFALEGTNWFRDIPSWIYVGGDIDQTYEYYIGNVSNVRLKISNSWWGDEGFHDEATMTVNYFTGTPN